MLALHALQGIKSALQVVLGVSKPLLSGCSLLLSGCSLLLLRLVRVVATLDRGLGGNFTAVLHAELVL